MIQTVKIDLNKRPEAMHHRKLVKKISHIWKNFNFWKLAFDLEKGVKVTKTQSTFATIPKVYPYTFGGNHAKGSRDISMSVNFYI